MNPGVQGRSPGPLSPHFSGEMGTPAGQAGPPGRCAPRPVSALPTRRVRSTGLPLAGGLGWDRRRSRPATWFPARLRAGARLSPEKAGGKSAGGLAPWTPFLMARSFPLARFGVGCRIVPVVGLLRCPSACPDLGRFFVWGYTTQRLPLGGKLSPKVTDEGAIDLPNGAGEKFRWGDWREPLRLSTRKGWVRNRPLIRPSVRTGAPSPHGEGFGGMSLIWKPSFPKMLFSIFYPENASQIGLSIPEEIAPRPYQSQQSPNPASGNERP